MPYSVVSVSGHMSRKGGGKFTLDLGVITADSAPDREPPAAKTLRQQLQDGSIPARALQMLLTPSAALVLFFVFSFFVAATCTTVVSKKEAWCDLKSLASSS